MSYSERSTPDLIIDTDYFSTNISPSKNPENSTTFESGKPENPYSKVQVYAKKSKPKAIEAKKLEVCNDQSKARFEQPEINFEVSKEQIEAVFSIANLSEEMPLDMRNETIKG